MYRLFAHAVAIAPDSQAMSAKAHPGASKSRKTHSRASTASVHSITTQPNLDQSGYGDAAELYATSWMSNDGAHAKDLSVGPQMSPEELLLQATSHIQSDRAYSMDHSMGPSGPMAHQMAYQQHPIMSRHPLPAETYVGNASFTEGDSQMMDRDDNDDGDSLAGAQKGGASRSSANNELEMRQLFRANKHRALPEIARELHGNERGPNSERTRQVFAMLWYEPLCSPAF
jgi:regulatory factor X, other